MSKNEGPKRLELSSRLVSTFMTIFSDKKIFSSHVNKSEKVARFILRFFHPPYLRTNSRNSETTRLFPLYLAGICIYSFFL